jgi:hypothetical protein
MAQAITDTIKESLQGTGKLLKNQGRGDLYMEAEMLRDLGWPWTDEQITDAVEGLMKEKLFL